MPKKTRVTGKPRRAGLEASLDDVGRRLATCRSLRTGAIAVRATGPGGGDFTFDCTERGVRVHKGPMPEAPPVIEIIGDTRRIVGVLAGEKDAVAQFLAGGFRLRGDLRYFSDLAVELGILKQPL
jgi:hypothetical protein